MPYLQYQLYAKHKGPLFPGVTLRKTSDVSGTSQVLLQPSTHQKPHLQQHSNQEQFRSTWQNKPTPQPSLSRPCTADAASTHTSADPKQRTPSDQSHKPPQSSVQTPHSNLGQRACQLQPQINSSCSGVQSSRKTVELRRLAAFFNVKARESCDTNPHYITSFPYLIGTDYCRPHLMWRAI